MQSISTLDVIYLWLAAIFGWGINILAFIWLALWIAKRYVRDALSRSPR